MVGDIENGKRGSVKGEKEGTQDRALGHSIWEGEGILEAIT